MEKYGVDCVVLNRTATIKYLTGAENTCSWVFLTRNGRRLAIVLESDYLDYRRQSILTDIRTHRPHDPEHLFHQVKEELSLKPGSLAAETEHLKTYQYWILEECFGDAINRRVCADKLAEEARMVKSADELERARKSAELGVYGIKLAREIAAKGMTEAELSRRIYTALLEKGAGESTFIYLAAGARSSLAHTPPSGNRLDTGPVTVDIHASYRDMYTDVGRTLFLGKNAGAEAAYQVLREAVTRTIDSISAGVTLADIRRNFHQSLKIKEGWIPLLGPVVHGIGLARPELPRFAHPWEGQGYPVNYHLEPNITMACSNIGIYSKEGWGVRYEDTFITTPGKPTVISAEA